MFGGKEAWLRRLQDDYFEWIMLRTGARRHRRLLKLLDSIEFVAVMGMDENRAADGADLRYRFAYEMGTPVEDIREALDIRPCSVLEMMAALAIRCEENIMDDPGKGDRTSEWFHEMLSSLGLSHMDNVHIDEAEARARIEAFLQRDYEPNGRGGLFTVRYSAYDMRHVEIWYQMMAWLNESLQIKSQ